MDHLIWSSPESLIALLITSKFKHCCVFSVKCHNMELVITCPFVFLRFVSKVSSDGTKSHSINLYKFKLE